MNVLLLKKLRYIFIIIEIYYNFTKTLSLIIDFSINLVIDFSINLLIDFIISLHNL